MYPQHTFSWRNKKNILWITPFYLELCSVTFRLLCNCGKRHDFFLLFYFSKKIRCKLSVRQYDKTSIGCHNDFFVRHLLTGLLPGCCRYSRFSLSRLYLSRITAYLEVNFWPLFKHENLTTGNKILWKRGEIAP